MRKLFIAITFFLLLAFSSFAQQRTGNIYVKVADQEGNPLPGVKVTLTGSLTAPLAMITNVEGNVRFISLSPGSDYDLKAEIGGFNRKTEKGLIVTAGTNINFTMVLETAVLEQQVTVTAKTPVVDSKKTAIIQNVTREALQSLPNARDIWVIMQMVPSIQIDREDVGGSQAGSMSGAITRGVHDTVISLDGTVYALYYDFDAFEEIDVSVGGSDVSSQASGVTVNLITRRGGNKMSFGGRFYVIDNKFQAENLTDALKKEGVVGTNNIFNSKDYGFNWGGPIVKDKAWFWMAYGVQDIKTIVLVGTRDDTLFTNYYGKLNFQLIPQNRLEIFGGVDNKEKHGRDASYTRPLGYDQNAIYHFGNPIVKVTDEHMFGDNLLVTAKYMNENAGFSLLAVGNGDLSKVGKYNVTTAQWDQDNYNYKSNWPRNTFGMLTNYFNDRILGVGHEIKLGFDFEWKTEKSTGKSQTYYYYNYNTPTIDQTGDGKPDIVPGIYEVRTSRFGQTIGGWEAFDAFLSDLIKIKNFNILLGLRYDRKTPKVYSYPVLSSIDQNNTGWTNYFTAGTAAAINNILPPFVVPEIDPGYSWHVLSPRLGITWDIQGKGTTVAKLFFGQYGQDAGISYGSFNPLGTGGGIDFWWQDNNKDAITDFTELYWHNSKTYAPYRVFDDAGNFIGNWNDMKNIMWRSFDPFNPVQTTNPNTTIDNSASALRTREVVATLEKEIAPNFAISVNFNLRKYDHKNWTLYYFPDSGKKESKADYVLVGYVPATVGPYSTGEGAGKPYYLRSAAVPATSYNYTTQRPDYNEQYYGLDLIVQKRLSNKWMLNASLTLQNQKAHYGNEGYTNPTQIWALDGQPYAQSMGGGSGTINQYIFTRWLAKASGLYQLPYDFNLGFTFLAREGHIIPSYFTITDYNAPNPASQSVVVYTEKFGNTRLGTFWSVNLRIEKLFKLGDTGRIYLMADLFNAFNNAMVIRRYPRNLGTYYPSSGLFVPNATNDRANEILSPRVARFGVRFDF